MGLYEKHQGRIQFVMNHLDHRLSPVQKELKEKSFRGSIPPVVVLDAPGSALYKRFAGVDDAVISNLLDNTQR